MTARVVLHRRGACPGLSQPMPTGDGLLVRLSPTGTIALDAFVELCAAARTHGSGIIEITGRGSIQIRGLDAASAPRFAADIAGLGIAAEDGVPVLTNPLAGIDVEEIFDAGSLAVKLRRALADASIAARLAPKVSVVIDGGGALNLDTLAADIRLRAEMTGDDVSLQVSVGGDGMHADPLGVIAPDDGVATVMRLLEVIARHGRDARARDILASEDNAPFRAALSFCPAMRQPGCHDARNPGEAIGIHRLRDGSLACGVELGFGHADAHALERLTEAARKSGADGIRAAPGRVLMTIGVAEAAASSFAAAAGQLGFIVRADDPRRRVVACAGAPVCASARIAARALAPLVAASAAPLVGGGFTIHISGCAKGCAHPASAALTVVGTAAGCALVANGTASDAAKTMVPADGLADAIAKYLRALTAEAGHG